MRKITILFISMITACSLSSCRDKINISDNSSGITQSSYIQVINNSSIPDEAKARLRKAYETEPATIAAEECNMDMFCSTVFINGKKLSWPLTLSDLGDGFEIFEDKDHVLNYKEESKHVSGYLSYYGNEVGYFSVFNCDSVDKITDLPLSSLIFTNTITDEKIFPVSINGVFIGANSEFMKERLYYMKSTGSPGDADKKTYWYHYSNDYFDAKCYCEEDKVNTIQFITYGIKEGE